MNLMTVALGVVCWLIAIVFGYRSVKHKETDGRLKVMRATLGEKRGVIFFRFTYVAMPIFIGSIIIVAGFQGLTIAEFFMGEQ
ncbi:hypothetical protein ACFOEK_10900 [Litoribrevibacter euphylliae]|uniref:Uncharacterized protein n=1 Tax=Litoribrevibacter euphylliae TaxID=1834034 RepID=A0ABV7HHD9_9GAMM